MNVATLAVRIAADINGFSPKLSKAERDFTRAARKMQDVGKSMAIGITLPFIAIGGAAVKMAADAEEAASKFDAVFGTNAKTMDRWVKEVRRSIPATSAELRGMTSEIQDLLVPLGMAPTAALKMTQSVTALAGDLASFNNIPMDEALQRIRSGLVGQYEPLLKFGVALSASTVKAEALRLGLIREGQELDANARAQASFSLILKGTTAAHGDAARTADSTANQMKFLASEVKETAIAFGGVLIPAVRPVVGVLRGVVDRLNDMSPAAKTAVVGIGGVAAAIGPAIYLTGAFAEKMIVLRRALIAVNGTNAMGGLVTLLGRFGPYAAAAGIVIGTITLAVRAHGKAARDAAADLDLYQAKVAGITSKGGLTAENTALQGQFDRLQAQRAALVARRTVTPMTDEQRDDPSQRAILVAGDRQRNFGINQEIAAVDAQLTQLAAKMGEVGTAYAAMMAGDAPGTGTGTGTPTDWLDAVDDRINVVTTAIKQFRETGVSIPGIGGAMAAAFDAIDAAARRAGDGVTAAANRVRAMRAELREAAGMGSGPPTFAGTVNTEALLRFQPARQFGNQVTGEIPAGSLAKADAEIRKVYETAKSNTANIVAELKNVPAQIAGNLASFLGPAFARMGVGGATGGMIGSAIGTGVGVGLGKTMGTVTGSIMGPLGGIVGGMAGAWIGKGIASLFGKHKDKATESAEALDRMAKAAERVTATLINLPQGFNVAYARYVSTAPEFPKPPSGGGPPPDPAAPRPPSGDLPPVGDDGQPRRGGSTASFTFTGPITVVTDSPGDFMAKLEAEAERLAARGGGSPMLAFAT